MVPVFNLHCEKALEAMGLQPTTAAIPVLGTRRLDEESENTYYSRLRGYMQFLLQQKDFDESLLLFYPYTPKGTVSCQEESVAYFILSKYGTKGEPVKDLQGNVIRTEDGSPILAMGGWNDPEACDGLHTALTHVHANAHGQTGEFHNKCEDCYKAIQEGGIRSCIHHLLTPRPVRIGNVMLSTLVRDTIAHIKAESEHHVQGACHLLPGDICDTHDYCVNSNDAFLLGIFVLLLTSIDLFLRKMEFSSLHEDNFNTEMFVLTDEFVIEALNLKVKGKKKCKKKKQGLNEQSSCYRYLYMWGDDAYPDLDLKRHLLAYLYIINWKGGYLFPSKEELQKPPADGIYKTRLQECDLYQVLKHIFANVLKRKDKLSAHTGRKSGYLFGSIRGADWFGMMLAADHDCAEVATRYGKDAEAIMAVNLVLQDERQKLGQWRSPHCAGDETAMRSTGPCQQFQKPLAELVVGFIEQRVGIAPTDPRRRHPKYLCEKVVAWKKPCDPMSQLRGHLELIATDKTQEIMHCFFLAHNEALNKARNEYEKREQDYLAQKLTAMISAFKGHLSLNAVPQEAVDSFNFSSFYDALVYGSNPVKPGSTLQLSSKHSIEQDSHDDCAEQPAMKEQRSGKKKVEGREKMQWWTAEKKLQFIDENQDDDSGAYQGGCRTWQIRASAIAKCYRSCCGKSVDRFLDRHGVIQGNKPRNFSFAKVVAEKLKGCLTCFVDLSK